MYYVYILHSSAADKYYIGFTSSLEGRLEAHNHPQNKGWSKRYQPWTLVYHESYVTKQNAMDREKKLKGLKSKNRIRELISKFTS